MAQVLSDEADWVLCAGCRGVVYGKRWERNLRVCPDCARHAPLTAARRAAQLLDEGSAEPLLLPVTAPDPLGFTDTAPYARRLAEARAATGMDDAVLCAKGTIEGNPVVLAVMDFRFMGGSLGTAVGEAITLAAETALSDRTPLIIVSASGGARMQEGALSLMQMAKTAAALAELDEAGVLTISVVSDPTFGGVAASFASLCDVIVAEPRARMGFAGRRVIEQTIRQRLPADFQTAEFLLERGFLDMVVPRAGLTEALTRLLRAAGPGRPGVVVPAAEVVRDPDLLPEHDPWRQVRAARSLDRPTTSDYLAMITTDFRELRGDRVSGDCSAVVAGTALLDGRPVVVIGHRKGHTAGELADHNFGMPTPAGYRKAARAMRLAAKLGIPVVTLVDTPGAYPGAQAEEQGQSAAIAENLRLMSSLPVPVITVITGEGGSGGALALAVANRVLMWGDSVYSVISPEGCAAILWKDAAAAPEAAAALRLGARDLLRSGVVDGVLPEPDGGVGADPCAAAERLRHAVVAHLDELSGMDGAALVKDRRARFRRFGAVSEVFEAQGVAR